ncbi:mechanosensitive ion channel protein MscS [Pelobium manganitolerans]|uniref:Mechanosensitive ion channel protein MscS n=1 Tax=Pelobium manganitolerans TaxID=1842495 RepID=A0A419S8P9_9SPHI|nr:mechanosensitive ion channel domain-containing protein [Pelobium manganitolerans]RKD18243.1 mechanosensitive ion channel protein MscS [Pelobium manganitolerans]
MIKLVSENDFWGIPNWLFDIIIIVVAILAGLVLKYILMALTRYYKSRSTFSFLRSSVLHLGRPLNVFLPLVFLNITKTLMVLPPRMLAVYFKLLEIGLIVAFAYILVNLIDVFQDFVFSSYDLKKADNLRERKVRTQLQFIRKILVAVVLTLTVAAVLFSFEGMRKLGAGLLTGVGVGGIIIGFAAQRSLSNFLAGLQIAFTQPIRIDDVLVVEGEWGRVEEITLTYVVVNIWDQRRLILPINYFIEKPFQNWTRTSAEILGTVFIYADYSLPLDALRAEFDRLVSGHPLWDKKVKVVQLTDAKENVVEIRCLVSAANSGQAFDLRCFVRENLIHFIQKNYPESLPKVRASLEPIKQLPSS